MDPPVKPEENDRTRYAEALSANPGPVFLAHRGHQTLEALTREIAERAPDAAFTAPDGIGHALWRADSPADVGRLERAFAEVPATYIADGHHRAASYARVAASRRAGAGAALTGVEPFNYFLAVHFPATELRILDYNRLVRDLGGLEPHALIDRIRARGFEIVPDHRDRRPVGPRSFGMYLAGRWYLLVAGIVLPTPEDPVNRLDVSMREHAARKRRRRTRGRVRRRERSSPPARTCGPAPGREVVTQRSAAGTPSRDRAPPAALPGGHASP